ncbi:MAG: glycosyltransferase family 8 protein [Hyphomicrobiales bacterium]|nr:MAG: glycosyltransferase family 8 protein [Hyphomicrobiales bacterium]
MMSADNSTGPIHIVLTFDDNFWAPAFAVMRSACLSTKRRTDLRFHLCVDGISAEHKADLDVITTEFGATLIYYDLTESADFQRICGTLRRSRRFPAISYARMVVDKILPPDVERVIYLDCDTFVLQPIERLYNQDMKGMPIAGVADPFAMHIMMGRDMRSKKGIFDPADPYFNSGVLLIDIAGFKAADIPARLEELRAQDILKRLYFDQDILNLIFRHRWTALNWRFNTIDPWRAQQAMGPYIVHYTGDQRPWHLVSLAPYHHMYRHTMTNELFYRFMRARWKRYWLKKLNRLIGRK